MMSRCVVSWFLVGRSWDAEVSGVVHEASCEADLIAQGVRRRDHVISRLQCDWRALSYNITVDLLGFLWVCDSGNVDLQASFMRHHRIEMNWRVKPIRSPKVLKGHDDHVITCLQFSGNRIVSGSDDNTLKVWSATTGKVRPSAFKHQIIKVDNIFCSKYSQLWIFWEKIMLYLNSLYYCTFDWFCYWRTVDI